MQYPGWRCCRSSLRICKTDPSCPVASSVNFPPSHFLSSRDGCWRALNPCYRVWRPAPALEAKLTFLIAVAGMGVVMLVARYREQGWKSAIGWIWFALGIAIPILALELYKLAALGVGGYQRHLESVRGFTDTQNIPLA